MKSWLFFALVILALPIALGRTGHITALSVADTNETNGGIADMFLEIRPGTGAIYIESYPLTKIDTQLSARFANEEACKRVSTSCSNYDFFYVIDSGSSLIGGPSAGGALTVLTYAVVEDLAIRNDTAMTGAILSGGIIGPVGSVPAKVSTARARGFSAVIVPAWDNSTEESTSDFTIIPIKTVDEAIAYFTQKQFTPISEREPPQGYTQGMKRVADTLCQHSQVLRSSLDKDMNATIADEQYGRAQKALEKTHYYSAASLCFSSSLESQTLLLLNASAETKQTVFLQIVRERRSLDQALKRADINTLADLELSMVVEERLSDVEKAIGEMNATDADARELAYSYERLETARSWLTMLGKVPSRQSEISERQLELSCTKKLSEAQERVNYLAYSFPSYTSRIEESMQNAFREAHAKRFRLCLLHASQAKAEANALFTAIYSSQDHFTSIIQQKISASQRTAYSQQQKGVFPILGYSYAEYASSLAGDDIYSASLYAEYSLEFSSLDIYFPEKKRFATIESRSLLIFFTGACIGAVAGILLHHIVLKGRSHRPKKRRVAAPLPGKKR